MLVVDDEERICRFLGRALRSAGYDVDSATTGPAALRAAGLHDYALIILDLMLPGLHGSEVLRRMLAARPGTRVLVLSAMTGIDARVGCLEDGAVDYMSKPFALAELLARVRSRIRQSPAPAENGNGVRIPVGPGAEEIEAGGVRLDIRRRSLEVHGDRRPLSHREYALLLHLMQRKGAVCTREELLSDVWGYTFDPGSNIVDVYIRRLRAKLDPGLIETVRNVGYSFVAD
jgi:DNA-binding response OmpR family regulator